MEDCASLVWRGSRAGLACRISGVAGWNDVA
jgi:hypothetical protein